MLIVVLLVDFVKVTTWALLGHILLQSHFLLTVHQKVLNLLLVQLFLNLLFLLSWFGFLFLTAIIFLVFRHIVFLVSTDASSLCQFFILHLFCLVIHRRCYNIKCLALRFLDLKYKIISFTRNLSISKLFLMRLVLHSFWLWVATSLLGIEAISDELDQSWTSLRRASSIFDTLAILYIVAQCLLDLGPSCYELAWYWSY